MFKAIFKSLTIGALLTFLSVGVANAAISVRLDQPKTPTNSSSFKVSFVTLDTLGGPVTVQCFKKGPSEGAFSQFGSDIALSSGGNTGNCASVSSFVSEQGTYQFYATSTGSSGTATSPTVSVDYNTSGPGTPTNFSKEKISSCVYRIKFKTADDSGKTVKVKLFRSDSSGSAGEVDSISIVSNTEGQFENTAPDCSKDYYYALRAYDSAGNASGTVGDSVVTSTTSTTTTTQASSASEATGTTEVEAIPVSAEEEEETVTPTEEAPAEEVLGEEALTDEEKQTAQRNKNIAIATGIGTLILLFSIYLYKRYKKV